MFKKGDYIVVLDIGSFPTDCAKNGYCLKQRKNNKSIHPYIDLDGSRSNGNNSLEFDKTNNLKDWRYATPQEIDEYERLGKPFDVTKITNSENPRYEIY